jgi:hypothetical protein
MLPAAKPTIVMPISTQIMPTALPNTNPPTSHNTAATIIVITKVVILESICCPSLYGCQSGQMCAVHRRMIAYRVIGRQTCRKIMFPAVLAIFGGSHLSLVISHAAFRVAGKWFSALRLKSAICSIEPPCVHCDCTPAEMARYSLHLLRTFAQARSATSRKGCSREFS